MTDDLAAAIARLHEDQENEDELWGHALCRHQTDVETVCDTCAQQAQEIARLREEVERQKAALDEQKRFVFNVAEGCHDYGGGHHSDGHMNAYQHGISTVVISLHAALTGTSDFQTATLERIGARRNAAALAEES